MNKKGIKTVENKNGNMHLTQDQGATDVFDFFKTKLL